MMRITLLAPDCSFAAVISLQQQIVHVIGEATSSTGAVTASYSDAVSVVLLRNVN
jgi:hypothetical protein